MGFLLGNGDFVVGNKSCATGAILSVWSGFERAVKAFVFFCAPSSLGAGILGTRGLTNAIATPRCSTCFVRAAGVPRELLEVTVDAALL